MGDMSDLVRRGIARTGRRVGRYPYVRVREGVGQGLLISLRNASANYALGTNEPPVQRTLEVHLRPRDVFYDIGSNIGFFSLVAARLVGSLGRVYAFEAVPANAKRIGANAARNRFANVDVLPVAVGRQAGGTVELLLSSHPGGASLAHDEPPRDVIGTLEVPAVTIDELVGAAQIRPPSMVKIDVEGTELAVLEGMAATIATHSPVLLVELDGPDPDRVAAKLEALTDTLAKHGYAPTLLDPSYQHSGWHVVHAVAMRG